MLTENWADYNNGGVVFEPNKLTREELDIGPNWAHKTFYSIPNIAKRFGGNMAHPFFYWATNIGYYFRNKKSWKEKMELHKGQTYFN